MWRDPYLGAAILAAPLFWAVLLVAGQTPLQPQWVLQEPARFALLALVYPILEEFVFRGLVQDFFSRRDFGLHKFAGLTIANYLTSLLFTLVHLFRSSLLWGMAVFVPSLVFGYFKDKYGKLILPVFLHVFYNAGYFLLFGS